MNDLVPPPLTSRVFDGLCSYDKNFLQVHFFRT